MSRGTLAILTLLAAAVAGFSYLGGALTKVDAQGGLPPNAANVHSITVTFDYDFRKTPACPPKEKTKRCIKEFDVYDVSGRRYKLFSIPAPTGATSVVKGITGRGAARAFEPGTHIIAVTAQDSSGVESEIRAARTSVEVHPKTPSNPPPAKY